MNPTQTTNVNGIDLTALQGVVDAINQDAGQAQACFEVETQWQGQTRSQTRVRSLTLGGQPIQRDHVIDADEPVELLGSNQAPNPQELLMAALNACMMVGYVAGAAVHGIELKSVKIITRGDIDLRGFLALDESVPAGYEKLDTTVQIEGAGTAEQFAAIHEHVQRTSPNYFNLSRAIALNAKLQVV
jgi:uncharacterized OsmC-like protein